MSALPPDVMQVVGGVALDQVLVGLPPNLTPAGRAIYELGLRVQRLSGDAAAAAKMVEEAAARPQPRALTTAGQGSLSTLRQLAQAAPREPSLRAAMAAAKAVLCAEDPATIAASLQPKLQDACEWQPGVFGAARGYGRSRIA